MARVVVIHGVAKQYQGPKSMHRDIATALVDGVQLANGPKLAEDDVEIAFYGDWFRSRALKGEPELCAMDIEDEFEITFLRIVWSFAAEVEPNRVPPFDLPRSKVAIPFSVQKALDALSHSSWLAGLADSFLLGALRQVRRYFTESATRSLVQQRLSDCIRSDTQLIVGHSLGSVAAYEGLHAHPEWPVKAFVTLGSPLGIANLVFDRLQPQPQKGRANWPGSVQSWSNISDKYDIVALVKELAPLFWGGETLTIHDDVVSNGWLAHDLKRHLTAEVTGQAISRGLSTIT